MFLALLLAAAATTGAPVTTCQALKTPNETYVLQNDVSAPDTCFSVEADNVTLDLNGHTITYASKPKDKAVPAFGVLAADCWFQPIAGNPCGGSHRNFTVEKGKIVQASGAPPFSHAIRFGQANDQDHITVHDLDITVSSPDSVAIYAEYLAGGSNIYRNTIHNNVTHITSRSQFRGVSIKLDSEEKARIPNHIHDNIIIGGAQAGIREVNPAGSLIYNNDISQDATYTNGFCIDAAGNNIQIYGNYCHPVHGRGIHVNHGGVSVHNNRIDTVDSDQDEEYGGCEINGTYGIQVESDDNHPSKVEVYNNDVTVHAAGCPAEAMRMTDLFQEEYVHVHDNTFRALADMTPSGRSTKGARALSLGNTFSSHIVFEHNHLIADDAMVYYDWDSGGNLTLKENDFAAGPHPAPKVLLIALDAGAKPSQNTTFLDCTFHGVSPEAAEFGNSSGASWYQVAVSRHMTAHDASGKPMAKVGLSVETRDNRQIFQGRTDEEGNILVPVPTYILAHVEDKPPTIIKDPSVALNFDKPGCPAETLQAGPAMAQAAQTIVCK
jgi:hypothetical protein